MSRRAELLWLNRNQGTNAVWCWRRWRLWSCISLIDLGNRAPVVAMELLDFKKIAEPLRFVRYFDYLRVRRR